MTPLETIKAFCENCEKEIKALNPIYSCPYAEEKKLCPQFQMVAKPLEALSIIIQKGIDVGWFKQVIKKDEVFAMSYLCDKYSLILEQYELLKEVLCKD